jgi:hypothetical protein
MKKSLTLGLIVAMLFLINRSVLAGELWLTKIGYNAGGYITFAPSSPGIPYEGPVYGGCVISFEQLTELSEHLELGYGIELQFGGTVNVNDYFRGFPFFVSLYYHPMGADEQGYYLLGRIGFNCYGYYGYDYYYDNYSLRNLSINGFYYTLGAGFQLSKYPIVRLEAFFTGNSGNAYYYDMSSDYFAFTQYTRFTIAIGFGMAK